MKLTRLNKIFALALGLMIGNAFAVQPDIKESAIVMPKPNEQHSLSTKRVTARLTQSHYHKFQLNDEFAGRFLTAMSIGLILLIILFFKPILMKCVVNMLQH